MTLGAETLIETTQRGRYEGAPSLDFLAILTLQMVCYGHVVALEIINFVSLCE